MRSAIVAVITALLLASAAPRPALAAPSLCHFDSYGSWPGVLALNLSTGQVPSALRIDPQIGAPAMSADRRRMYVPIDGGIAVVDVRRLRVIDTIPVATTGALAVAPDDTIYFVDAVGAPPMVHALDVRRHTTVAVTALPDDADFARSPSLGDDGRLLFVSVTDADTGAISVVAVDLVARTIRDTWTSPNRWAGLDVAASPTGAAAFIEQNSWYDGDDDDSLLLWQVGADPELLPVAPGRALPSPDGTRLYVRHGTEPTVLVDTASRAPIATLPGGEVVIGFAADDCLILAEERQLRLACPGEASAQPIAAEALSPENTALVGTTAWTDGACTLPPARCDDGVPCLEVVGADGSPGDTVEVRFRLHTAGAQIAGLQNDLYLDPALGMPGTRPDHGGRLWPRCRVNPDIGKEPTIVSCREAAGPDCLTGRALVLSLLDLDPIPDGSVTYSCEVRIPPDVAAGTYPVGCVNALASDSAGNDVALQCQDGAVTVAAPPGGAVRAAGAGTAAAGCQVVASGAAPTTGGWLLVLLGGLALRPARRCCAPPAGTGPAATARRRRGR